MNESQAPFTLESNFEIIFRNLEHLLFCEILQKKITYDWSVGQCLQTSNEASTMLFTYGFRKCISNVLELTFKRKISKFLFENGISKQEAFEKCWAHSPLRAAARPILHCHSPGVATVARRLRIDVHDNDNDNNDNA